MDLGPRTVVGAAAGACLVLAVGASTMDTAHARRAGPGKPLRVVSVSVDGLTQVALNQVIQIRFDRRVSRRSLTNGAISVLPLDRTTGATGDPRPGELRRRGNRVQFIPRLPTQARAGGPAGEFFPAGSPQDDAFENGSFRIGTDYVVRIAGRPEKPAATSASGAKLRRTVTTEFRTADGASPGDPPFLLETYADTPPLRMLFANPTDRVVEARRSYAVVGGTPSVPTDIHVTLFGTGIPLDPTTIRAPGAVQLIRVETPDGSGPTPVVGDALLEQDRNRMYLVFRPAEPLSERSTYALRVDESVTDLTGNYHVSDDPERARLTRAYEFLVDARRANPGVPVEFLAHPPVDLIFDWPPVSDADRGGVLKRNLLEIGDTRPWELDPRVFAVFTTVAAERPGTPPLVSEKRVQRRRPSLGRVTRVVTQLGLQGAEGAGQNVVIPFTLVQRRGRPPAFIEVQWGADHDLDGAIEEEEFSPATIDERDGRQTGATRKSRTRRGRARHQFVTAPGSGRSNATVWRSTTAVLGPSVFPLARIAYTPQGREIEDPDNPGSPLIQPGRGGAVIRLRTVRGRRASAWSLTAPFALINSSRPALTLDGARPGAPTLIDWTAFDADSEDANGNGVLDVQELEDRNGDGLLDTAPVAVAFDFHLLGSDDDPATLTAAQLADLDWLPCSRAAGLGDPDDGVPSSPAGLAYTFAWDSVGDGVVAGARVILRGRPFDAQRIHGPWVYLTEPLTVED